MQEVYKLHYLEENAKAKPVRDFEFLLSRGESEGGDDG